MVYAMKDCLSLRLMYRFCLSAVMMFTLTLFPPLDKKYGGSANIMSMHSELMCSRAIKASDKKS